MARNYNGSKGNGKRTQSRGRQGNGGQKKGKSYSQYRSEILTFAEKMGAVKRGLKNPDSAISEAYKTGVEVKEKKGKKPLF